MNRYIKLMACVLTVDVLMLLSCKVEGELGDNVFSPPVLTTFKATNITSSSATLGGNIIFEGTHGYIERGLVFATEQNPTIDNNKTMVERSETSYFSVDIIDLSSNRTYYVRAYAINKAGPFYGEQIVFTTKNGVWTQKADFPGGARIGAVGFSIGGKGYIGAGGGFGVDYKDFWEYDPVLNIWTQKEDFAGRNARHGFSIGDKGYIGFGEDGQDFWEYDPGLNNWSQKTDFPGGPRSAAVCFSIGNKGYIGTGETYDETGYRILNDFWEYDPVSNIWTKKTDFAGIARRMAVGFSIGNKGYIGTGNYLNNTSYRVLSDFWEYDPISNAWTGKKDIVGDARYIAVGFSIGNKGYIGTGLSDRGFLFQDFLEYNPVSNIWTQNAEITGKGRHYAVGFSIGNKGYMGTGWFVDANDNRLFNDFWEFEP